MTNLRTVAALVVLLFASLSFAKPPAPRRTCDAEHACDRGRQCVAHSGGDSTCEQLCGGNGKCPEEQRCVKDGAQLVCRPINDGVGL
ncbi:MAG TPA: hypothetical protein VIA18_24450 [Polyangia bacterium]|jgi:hypothetical protein|nr:hypothetical protein [Polyangia bacterium]